jgi:hypothetical protein
MQRNDPEKREALDVRDLERPFSEGFASIDAVIEVVKSDWPEEWSQYCCLAHQLVQPKQSTEISQEEAGRQLLSADGKHVAQKLARDDGVNAGYAQLAGFGRPPETHLQRTVAATQKFEDLFRNRLVLALQSGRYSLKAFDRLEPRTVPPALIKAEHFRFDSDEMEVNEIKLTGVHFVRAQAVPAPRSDPPGPKPGQQPVADLACTIAVSILNDETQRPARRHGRKAELARMVCARLPGNGRTYKEDTIVKLIRGAVKEWEDKNPGK